MSDEEKKPEIQDESSDTTTTEVVSAEELASEEETAQDSEYDEKLRQLEVDKAKADEERDNLQKALTEARSKLKEAKEAKSEEGSEPKEPPVDYDKIKEVVEKATDAKVQQFRVDMGVATFNEELEKLTTNEKEKELIKEHYRQSIKPSGIDRDSIRHDLLLCKAAANLNHLKFGNQPDFDPKITTAMGASGGSPAKAVGTTDNLNEDEKRFAKIYGVDEKKAAKAKSGQN